MIIYIAIITEEQADELSGNTYTSDSYFNPFQIEDLRWCISEEEVFNCVNTELKWVNRLAVIEYDRPDEKMLDVEK